MLRNNEVLPEVPVLQNIHQLVLDAAAKPYALNMRLWHTCDTTHCRAGWVVHLAGPAGYALEEATSTEFAAKQIYKKSSPIHVSPNMFYVDNETSLADMQLCADEEKKLQS
jgi:hypothetical protein